MTCTEHVKYNTNGHTAQRDNASQNFAKVNCLLITYKELLQQPYDIKNVSS